MDFRKLGISEDLVNGLDHMNIRKPTPIQEQAIPAVLEGRDLIAVSYTHLRAHETVLDLVCRLLLEKKKKTTSTIETRQKSPSPLSKYILNTHRIKPHTI